MDTTADSRLALTAAVLYLLNLLLLPGVAFIVLAFLWWRHRHTAGAIARSHLSGAMAGSIVAGVLLVCVAIAIVLSGGLERGMTWVVLVLYVTTVHAGFVLAGVVALTRAMANQPHFLRARGDAR